MCTVLRAYGRDFDVDAFLAGCSLQPCSVRRRGEPRCPKSDPDGRVNEKSGINIGVSDADCNEFPRQVEETIAFLRNNAAEIRRLVTWPNVGEVSLDFGIERRDVYVQCDYLPAELIRRAGELGLGIELSYYPISKEDEGTS